MKKIASAGALLLIVLLAAGVIARPGLGADPATLKVVGSGGGPGQATLTLDDLRRLGATELRTATSWTQGTQIFVGVTGARLVQELRAQGREVVAEAVNGYRIVIPFDVFAAETTIIAYSRNGQPMTVREKGPLWVVFPFDADAKFRSDRYKSYAIWSLISVEFR